LYQGGSGPGVRGGPDLAPGPDPPWYKMNNQAPKITKQNLLGWTMKWRRKDFSSDSLKRIRGDSASSSSSIYSQPIRPSALESSSRSQTEEDSTVPANYNRSLWRTESTGAEHIQTRTAAEAARNQVIVVR